MNEIGKVDFFKCSNCGFTFSKTHQELSFKKWDKLNYDFHHFHENNIDSINQPPYIEMASMIKVLSENHIIDSTSILDYAAGYGTLSKILKKYFNFILPMFDPYITDTSGIVEYIDKDELSKYKTIINSALFEHLLSRTDFDKINDLVNENGCMIIHTVICENIPNDPDWFYFQPPVHCAFHTNKSMEILMSDWNYESSIYCPKAKSWILLKKDKNGINEKVKAINKELQNDYYLFYKKGFFDYWKGFNNKNN